MPISSTLVAITGLLAFAEARLKGRRSLSDPIPEGCLQNLTVQSAPQACGPCLGSCASGFCCGENGLCGTGLEPCGSPRCQLDYSGEACYASIPPQNGSTLHLAREKFGALPYGHIIRSCTTPGTIALTFDDGPFNYTDLVLDLLAQNNMLATFFLCGNNNAVGPMDDPDTPWPSVLHRMHAAGHQLASHTWTHYDLSTVSAKVREQQIIYNEMAFRNVLGFFPTYIRPPYASCTVESGCTADLDRWGYHIINYDVDTRDFNNDDEDEIQDSMDIFDKEISWQVGEHSYIPIAHDNHYWTAAKLTEHMIRVVQERGYRAVTVGECLGDERENWYRDARETLVSQPMEREHGEGGNRKNGEGSNYDDDEYNSDDEGCETCPVDNGGCTISHEPADNDRDGYENVGYEEEDGDEEAEHEEEDDDEDNGDDDDDDGDHYANLAVSLDGVCGEAAQLRCRESACCSRWDHCGFTYQHCRTGCQSRFGACA